VKEFARVRARGREAVVLHGDARSCDFGGGFDGVVTSPPVPGLIDYHEQHRYAYELLGLDECRELELGKGRRARRCGRTSTGLRRSSRTCAWRCGRSAGGDRDQRPARAVPGDPGAGGLRLEERYRRHVNRRTGRRAGEYFEDVLVARAPT
jgi:hypothetical protein